LNVFFKTIGAPLLEVCQVGRRERKEKSRGGKNENKLKRITEVSQSLLK